VTAMRITQLPTDLEISIAVDYLSGNVLKDDSLETTLACQRVALWLASQKLAREAKLNARLAGATVAQVSRGKQ